MYQLCIATLTCLGLLAARQWLRRLAFAHIYRRVQYPCTALLAGNPARRAMPAAHQLSTLPGVTARCRAHGQILATLTRPVPPSALCRQALRGGWRLQVVAYRSADNGDFPAN